MTDEEVSCLMHECCDKDKVAAFHNDFWTITQEELVRFARLIAARQREKDAEICEQRNLRYAIPFVAVEECAVAIREQGEN